MRRGGGRRPLRPDLTAAEFTGAGTVSAVTAHALTVTGLSAFAAGWFARGRITWATGANAGAQSEVRAHSAGSVTQALVIWRLPAADIAPGDTFTVTAGCDKSWDICRAKFANGPNFRGHPHMPGETFPAEYAEPGDPALDGGSRFDG